MNSILTFFKKDIKTFRVQIAIWSGLLLTPYLWKNWVYYSAAEFDNWRLFYFILFLFLYPFYVIRDVIRQESIHGTSEFWFTRPLSRKQLFLEKGLFLSLVFILLPVSIELFFVLLHGATLIQVRDAVISVGFYQLTFVLIAWSTAIMEKPKSIGFLTNFLYLDLLEAL